MHARTFFSEAGREPLAIGISSVPRSVMRGDVRAPVTVGCGFWCRSVQESRRSGPAESSCTGEKQLASIQQGRLSHDVQMCTVRIEWRDVLVDRNQHGIAETGEELSASDIKDCPDRRSSPQHNGK